MAHLSQALYTEVVQEVPASTKSSPGHTSAEDVTMFGMSSLLLGMGFSYILLSGKEDHLGLGHVVCQFRWMRFVK